MTRVLATSPRFAIQYAHDGIKFRGLGFGDQLRWIAKLTLIWNKYNMMRVLSQTMIKDMKGYLEKTSSFSLTFREKENDSRRMPRD